MGCQGGHNTRNPPSCAYLCSQWRRHHRTGPARPARRPTPPSHRGRGCPRAPRRAALPACGVTEIAPGFDRGHARAQRRAICCDAAAGQSPGAGPVGHAATTKASWCLTGANCCQHAIRQPEARRRRPNRLPRRPPRSVARGTQLIDGPWPTGCCQRVRSRPSPSPLAPVGPGRGPLGGAHRNGVIDSVMRAGCRKESGSRSSQRATPIVIQH